MVDKIRVRDVDGELGVVLPLGVLEHLGVSVGDTLYASVRNGGILLTKHPPEVERANELSERGSAKYQNALRELAG